MTVPYIITTKRPSTILRPPSSREWASVSRRVVATLEEARDHVSDLLDKYGSGGGAWIWGVAGGTVGPLPDGTTIEVEPLSWLRLRNAVAMPHGEHAALIDAYNARGAA